MRIFLINFVKSKMFDIVELSVKVLHTAFINQHIIKLLCMLIFIENHHAHPHCLNFFNPQVSISMKLVA